MKSVQVIMPHFYPVAAGIETNVLETYSVLAKKGWKVTVILVPHGFLTPHWNMYSKTRRFLRKIVYRLISIFLINFVVDGIRVVSHWEKN